MATDQDFVDFVLEQLDPSLRARARKMFGEYALYAHEKVVALVCDNQVFVKPTDDGRAFIGRVVEAPPYEGAKPSFLIGEGLEDEAWFSELIAITERALPKPKPKKKKAGQAGRKRTPAAGRPSRKSATRKRAANKAPRSGRRR